LPIGVLISWLIPSHQTAQGGEFFRLYQLRPGEPQFVHRAAQFRSTLIHLLFEPEIEEVQIGERFAHLVIQEPRYDRPGDDKKHHGDIGVI
jgi:hypothetical protein